MTTITLKCINGVYMESSLSPEERDRICRKAHDDMVKASLASKPAPAPQPQPSIKKDVLESSLRKFFITAQGGLVVFLLYLAAKLLF